MTEGVGGRLSPRRMEYLKFLLERGEPVTNADLAARFGVDPSTSTKTIRALVEAGLVVHAPYRGISLSERGRRCAEFLTRRHRLLALAFARMGMEPETACEQAARCEDRIPRDVVNTICAAMGHPTRSECGAIARDRGCCVGREE
ncbi:MAG: metal-dependent transcriptional regulator [Methanospirillum sp.]